MRWFCLLFLCGCDASRDTVNHNLDGFIGGGEDLSAVAGDLAGADVSGVTASDMAHLDKLDLATSGDLRLPPPDGSGTISVSDTCGSAPALSAGLLYDDQDTTGLADDYHIGALAAGGCNTN